MQYRMPSPAAWSRGQEAAKKILDAHVADTGEFPETIAVRTVFRCLTLSSFGGGPGVS